MPDISEVKVNGIEYDVKDEIAREHINADNIKTYTTFLQLGLADADFAGMSFFEIMQELIINKMPPYSSLRLGHSPQTIPNLTTALHTKLIEDLGVTIPSSCPNVTIQIDKNQNDTMATPIYVYLDYGEMKGKILTCMFETDDGIPVLSRFAYSYHPDGFLTTSAAEQKYAHKSVTSDHMNNKNNPHGVTAEQLKGVLSVANGGTGAATLEQAQKILNITPKGVCYVTDDATGKLYRIGMHNKELYFVEQA